MVFAQEFLEQARARLQPHGIYAQWFYRDEMDPETLDLLFSTYASVFDNVSVWYMLGRDLLLIGFNDDSGAGSMDRIVERASRSDMQEAFGRVNVAGLSGLLAHEIIPSGVISSEKFPDTVHTLQHPRLSHSAAKAFFRDPSLPPVPKDRSIEAIRTGTRNSLARRYAQSLNASELEAHREAMLAETCKYLVVECMVLIGEWFSENPDSPELRSAVDELQNDPDLKGPIFSGVPGTFATLFEGPGHQFPESVSPTVAKFWEKTFFDNHEYAAPFSFEILLEIWRRCEDEDPSLCEAGLRELEQKLK
jgi:hypothetical protein